MRNFIIVFLLCMCFSVSYGQTCSCSSGGCNITATIPFGGEYAEGTYSIELASGHTTITNPIIFVEGLDIDNNIDCNTYLPFVSSLTSQGFDVIFIDFSSPLDEIEKNAFLLVELIEIIKNNYTNNKLIIFGQNTGAIISRYSLVYMEENNMDHNTKLYVSYDGPHQGFNFPIGLNLLNDKLSLFNPVSYLMKLNLSRPIFSELLIYGGPFPPSSSTFSGSDVFFNNLKSMNDCNGYPKNCRKIAISGGSGIGVGQNNISGNAMVNSPGDVFFMYSSNKAKLSGACSSLRTTPLDPPGYYTLYSSRSIIGDHAFQLSNQHIQNLKPVDHCPGSYSDFIYTARSLISTLSDDVVMIKNFDNATFVPTISALDINTDDLFFDLSSVSNISDYTSFDDVKFQNYNYKYTSNTPILNSINFILSNINIANSYLACDADVEDITIDLDENTKVHTKNNTILGSSIENNVEAIFLSEGYVEMKPGFHAKMGSNVDVLIKPCIAPVCEPLMLSKKESEMFSIVYNERTDVIIPFNLDDNLNLSIYPNPFIEFITIKSDDIISSVEIFDVMGRLVINITDIGEKKVKINTSDLLNGTYFLSARTNSNSITKKIIKK